jgi:hypothetical protein
LDKKNARIPVSGMHALKVKIVPPSTTKIRRSLSSTS